MSYTNFRTIPSSQFVGSNPNSHYDIPLIPWFRSNGHPSEYPDTFTADVGNKWTFNSNVDPNSYNYVYAKTDTFWPSDNNYDKGFSIQSPTSRTHHQFNYKVSGGKGFWLPCPIFASASWYWSRETSNGGDWFVKHFGLVLKNWKTDEEKVWAAGLNNNNPDTQTLTIHVESSINHVRNMGPDWYIYGVIFNIVSPATNNDFASKAKLVDFRLGYNCKGLTGTNRLVLTKEMTWNNLSNALKSGQMKYEPISIDSNNPDDILKDTKIVAYDGNQVNDNTFVPITHPNGWSWNEWTGNCKGVVMAKMSGIDLLDYAGTYSNVTITFINSNNGALIYKGNITKIEPYFSIPELTNITIEKIEDNDGGWPKNTNIDIVIEGLT